MVIEKGALNLSREVTPLKGLSILETKEWAGKIAPPTQIIQQCVNWAQVCPCATECDCGPLAKLVSFGSFDG